MLNINRTELREKLGGEKNSDSISNIPPPAPPQNLTGKQDPLLNPLVLQRLFALCDPKDLPNFRLVSKLWYAESLSHCRKEMVLQIPQFTEPLLDELADQLTAAGNKAFRSFRFLGFVNYDDFLFGNTPNATWPLKKIWDFWDDYGPRMHKVELVNCRICDPKYFESLWFELTPNLKELHLIDSQVEVDNDWEPFLRPGVSDDEEVRGEGVQTHLQLQLLRIKLPFTYPTSWRRLISRFPNLRTFEVDNIEICYTEWWRMENPALSELLMICEEFQANRLKLLVTLRNAVFKLKLRRTILDDGIGINHLLDEMNRVRDVKLILRALRPKLINISVDLDVEDWRDEEIDFLAEIIRLGGETMKGLTLKVDRVFGSEIEQIRNFPFGLGPNSSLTKLRLDGNIFCENLHFLEEFPNLEELRLEIKGSNEMLQGTDLTRMGKAKLVKLQLFQYFDNSSPRVAIPEEVLELFIRMMPNLECFEAPLTNSLLRVVFRDWTQLRELHTDSKDMREEDKIKDEDFMGVGAGGDDKLPNIMDMKNLEIFSLRVGIIP